MILLLNEHNWFRNNDVGNRISGIRWERCEVWKVRFVIIIIGGNEFKKAEWLRPLRALPCRAAPKTPGSQHAVGGMFVA